MQVIDAQGICRTRQAAATRPRASYWYLTGVDVGISGGTAQVVGELLRELGQEQQIIAITHQSQVAAQSTPAYFGL